MSLNGQPEVFVLRRDLTFDDFVQKLAEGICKFILKFNGEIVVFCLVQGKIKLVYTEDRESFITVPVQDIGQFDWLGRTVFKGEMTVVSLIRNICLGQWPLQRKLKGTKARNLRGLETWLNEPKIMTQFTS